MFELRWFSPCQFTCDNVY